MTAQQLDQLLLAIEPTIQATGAFIRTQLGQVRAEAIETKAMNSLVSYVDKRAEEMLVEGLGRALPAATFLTEEETVAQEVSELRWIIDPLDGTTNFLHSIPHFAVSVALESKGELLLGVVLEPNQNDYFSARKGGGAYLNGQSIQVSSTLKLADALLAIGYPYTEFGSLERFLDAMGYLAQHSRGMRRMGAAALDLAYTAAGRFDGFYEMGLHAWDVAGGALLVEEAGGKVSGFGTEEDFLFGGKIIATNKHIYAELLEVLERFYD